MNRTKKAVSKEEQRRKRGFYATISVTLFVLIVIIAYTFSSFYAFARQGVLTLGEKVVAEKSEALSNFLRNGLDVLQVTGLTVEYMLENGATSEELERFLLRESEVYTEQIDESFTGVYGVFRDVYIDGIGWVPDEGYVPQTRPWYLAAAENAGKPTIVSPYVDAQTGKVMISVSQLLSDGESAIALDIYMDEMQEMAQDIQLAGGGYGFILDDAGLVVAHSDAVQTGKNYLLDEDMQGTEMNAVARQILAGGGEAVPLSIDGDTHIAFSQLVQDRWHVVMVVDQNELFADVTKTLYICIGFAVLLLAIVVYFCATSHRNREKAIGYAAELQDYQHTLEERVEEQTQEIVQQSERMVNLQKSVVERMATLIESRDGNTGEHVKNTKSYAAMLVQYMYEHHLHSETVTEKYVENVITAAVLHDVGKIHISDAILNKPGRFTPEEYSIMKTHAAVGGVIVKDILGEEADEDLVQVASDIAYFHHEKWDGSGYPTGLKADDIPLSARVMAVADVFDALVSKRVYKDAVTLDETYRILHADAGSHFDPELIEIFTAIRPKVGAYLEKRREVREQDTCT